MGTYHVRETDSGWELIKYGATRASKRAASKVGILKKSQRFLETKVASLVIHHEDGSLQHIAYPTRHAGVIPPADHADVEPHVEKS